MGQTYLVNGVNGVGHDIFREEQRESFRQDTLDAWRAYQETGLHVTGDEVVAWLNSWGEENELPPPIPHT